MAYAGESMRARIALSGSPKADKGTYKVDKLKDDYELTPVRIQDILNRISSRYGVYNERGIGIVDVTRSHTRRVMGLEEFDFSELSDEDIYKKFFGEFDEKNFATYMDVAQRELKVFPSEIPEKVAVNVLISAISKYCKVQKEGLTSSNDNIRKRRYLLELIQEFEERLVNSLRKEIDSL